MPTEEEPYGLSSDRCGTVPPYDENVALTKKVVEYAHQFDVTVEGELGVLAGVEDEVSSDHHTYTEPDEVVDFVTKTGCDSLAISIGTSHGAYKFTPEQCQEQRFRRKEGENRRSLQKRSLSRYSFCKFRKYLRGRGAKRFHVETKSPVILQVSKGARQYANATLLRYMAQGAVEYAKEP